MVKNRYMKENFLLMFSAGMVYFFLSLPVLAKNESLVVDAFKSHCIECHGAKGKVKGEVNLLSFTQGKDIRSDPELLQTVLEVIDWLRSTSFSRFMPSGVSS